MAVRWRRLDGLRGLLALYVLAGHMAPFLLLPAPFAWLAGMLSHGRAAVELFFVLSGMVILRSLGLDGGAPLGAGRFLAARAGRLLPVYLIALGFAAAVLSLGDPFTRMPWLPPRGAARDIAEAGWAQPWLAHIAAHLALAQGVLPPALLPHAEFTILGPAWSLSTEWQFYLVIAAVLVSGRDRPRSSDAWLPFTIMVMLIGMAGLLLDRLPPAWQLGRAFLPHEAWYFALGMASCGLCGMGDRRAAGLCWALAAGGIVCVSWGQTPGATLAVPLVWAACLLCEEPGLPRPAQRLLRPWSALLQAAPLQWLGGLSYPLYLIHAPVQRLLMLAVGPLAGGSWACFTLVWAPLAVLLPLAAAYPLHRRVELPCWRWSRAWATGAGTPLSSSSAHVMRGPTRLAARTASGRRDG